MPRPVGAVAAAAAAAAVACLVGKLPTDGTHACASLREPEIDRRAFEAMHCDLSPARVGASGVAMFHAAVPHDELARLKHAVRSMPTPAIFL